MSLSNSFRKRGDRLTESIYNATIEIIRIEGYRNLTFQQIARIAKTSRTVLYRRWATPFDLIHEIVSYKSFQALEGELVDKIKDTGSLRGDLLYLLTLYQKIYIHAGLEIMNAVLFEMSQNNVKISEIKKNATSKNIIVMERLLEFAKNRGDQIKKMSECILTLPFDLIRIRYLMGTQELSQAALEQLVDEILLPVFT